MLLLLSYTVVKVATASFTVTLNVTCNLFVELTSHGECSIQINSSYK